MGLIEEQTENGVTLLHAQAVAAASILVVFTGSSAQNITNDTLAMMAYLDATQDAGLFKVLKSNGGTFRWDEDVTIEVNDGEIITDRAHILVKKNRMTIRFDSSPATLKIKKSKTDIKLGATKYSLNCKVNSEGQLLVKKFMQTFGGSSSGKRTPLVITYRQGSQLENMITKVAPLYFPAELWIEGIVKHEGAGKFNGSECIDPDRPFRTYDLEIRDYLESVANPTLEVEVTARTDSLHDNTIDSYRVQLFDLTGTDPSSALVPTSTNSQANSNGLTEKSFDFDVKTGNPIDADAPPGYRFKIWKINDKAGIYQVRINAREGNAQAALLNDGLVEHVVSGCDIPPS